MIYNHAHDDSTQRKITPMKAEHVKMESAKEDDPIYKEPPMAITLGWWHQVIRDFEKQNQRGVDSEEKNSTSTRKKAKPKQKKKS